MLKYPSLKRGPEQANRKSVKQAIKDRNLEHQHKMAYVIRKEAKTEMKQYADINTQQKQSRFSDKRMSDPNRQGAGLPNKNGLNSSSQHKIKGSAHASISKQGKATSSSQMGLSSNNNSFAYVRKSHDQTSSDIERTIISLKSKSKKVFADSEKEQDLMAASINKRQSLADHSIDAYDCFKKPKRSIQPSSYNVHFKSEKELLHPGTKTISVK